MELLDALWVVGLVLWPILCYNLAKRKNRNTGTAVVMGILFGIFALLYYATVGELKEKEGGS